MSLKFLNIHTKEVLVAEGEPMIAALWASSDRSPNLMQGQDFGWRFAPEVVVELRRIKRDRAAMKDVAATFDIPLEDIKEPDILQYISRQIDAENAPVAEVGDYTDSYLADIQRLERESVKSTSVDETGKTVAPEKESLEDLEKRVLLEERLAAAREKTSSPETTTTTTPALSKPIETTTTTTKR